MFADYIHRWQLIPDGSPLVTASSCLLPVLWHGQKAMLKIALVEEEKPGLALMAWWNGTGAAPVFTYDSSAVLMERADDRGALAELCRAGQDTQACRIICSVIEELHQSRANYPLGLTSLPAWFKGLQAAAASHAGILQASYATASELLADPREVGVLHGDIHHGNILHFGARGWLAIDPKGLLGERTFDYANLFCNPGLETAGDFGDFGGFINRLGLVADMARLDRQRLLQWILAWAGLSATWHYEDGTCANTVLKVATMAAAELARYGKAF